MPPPTHIEHVPTGVDTVVARDEVSEDRYVPVGESLRAKYEQENYFSFQEYNRFAIEYEDPVITGDIDIEYQHPGYPGGVYTITNGYIRRDQPFDEKKKILRSLLPLEDHRDRFFGPSVFLSMLIVVPLGNFFFYLHGEGLEKELDDQIDPDGVIATAREDVQAIKDQFPLWKSYKVKIYVDKGFAKKVDDKLASYPGIIPGATGTANRMEETAGQIEEFCQAMADYGFIYGGILDDYQDANFFQTDFDKFFAGEDVT